MKQLLKKLLPSSLLNVSKLMLDRWRLARLASIACDTTPLRQIDLTELKAVFNSKEIQKKWQSALHKLEPMGLARSIKGGINLGDRQAIYHLIHHLKPSAVLEIGTHVGASTGVIALALSELATAGQIQSPTLTTVDIRDVNDTTLKPWQAFGATHSPKEVLTGLGYDELVEFVVDDAKGFFKRSRQKFDFVFLDGDHAATAVYQEIPQAIAHLNPGGVVLLHDVFPNLKPLWANGTLIPGPWLGVQRHQEECKSFNVLPLGELPWPTKLGSNITSLALLCK